MRAAVRTRYGGPDVVRLVEVPDPVPGAGVRPSRAVGQG